MQRTLFTLLLLIGLLGCQGQISEEPPIHPNPNMDNQPRFDPQEASAFFSDGRAQRVPVAGTVARGQLKADPRFYLGRESPDGPFVTHGPVAVTEPLLRRGAERFRINCSACHGQVGDGKGILMNEKYRGTMVPIPSFHQDRIRAMPDGEIFHTITHGVRTMPSYRHQIPEADRWAIVAYLRALQRSQETIREDIPDDIEPTLEERK